MNTRMSRTRRVAAAAGTLMLLSVPLLSGTSVRAATRPPGDNSNPPSITSSTFAGTFTTVTFYERTGGIQPIPHTYSISDPVVQKRRTFLDATHNDFLGTATEAYDVFLSDCDGTPNTGGSYMTVEARFPDVFPAGGGLNLAEVKIDKFTLGVTTVRWGTNVCSFQGMGNNADPASVGNAVDGDKLTHTTMGNTSQSLGGRLRVTVGFA